MLYLPTVPPLKTIKQLLKIDQRQIFANQRQMLARCWFACGGVVALGGQIGLTAKHLAWGYRMNGQ